MNIALVCPDGLSIVLFCKGIIRALHRIPGAEVLVVSDEGEYRRDIEALGAVSMRVPISRYATPLADVRYCAVLYRLFRRERCDLVLNFSTKPNIYGTFAARAAGVPRVVSHVVGLGGAFMPVSGLGARFVGRVASTLYRIAARWSDRLWFTNRHDLAYFVDRRLIPPEKAILTRNYLDTDEYAPETVTAEEINALRRELGLGDADRLVIMVARLIWAKGVRQFVEAAEMLRDRLPHVLFLLVAPPELGNPDAVPEGWVVERQALGNFRWTGFRRDIKQLYALSSVAVAPTYYKEGGYPRSLLEPMAMARPVVTTDSDDCRGAVDEGRNGFVVPIKNAAALADAIATLMTDDRLREAFGRHSREKAVREFDERAIIDEALERLGVVQRDGQALRCVDRVANTV